MKPEPKPEPKPELEPKPEPEPSTQQPQHTTLYVAPPVIMPPHPMGMPTLPNWWHMELLLQSLRQPINNALVFPMGGQMDSRSTELYPAREPGSKQPTPAATTKPSESISAFTLRPQKSKSPLIKLHKKNVYYVKINLQLTRGDVTFHIHHRIHMYILTIYTA